MEKYFHELISFLHLFLVFFFVFLIRDSPSFSYVFIFLFSFIPRRGFSLSLNTDHWNWWEMQPLSQQDAFFSFPLSSFILSFTVLLAVFSVRSFTLLFFLSLTFPFFSLSHLLSFHFTFSYCPYFRSLFLHYFLFFLSLSPFRFLLIYVSLSLKI